MNRLNSRRPLALLFAAFSVIALSAPAQAGDRPHKSRGTAQFVSANDFIGAGHATHLGNYTEVGRVQFSPTADPTVLQIDACAIYTAANGDRLYAIFSGVLNGLTGTLNATVTYVGGTGRFEDASGSAELLGQLQLDGTLRVVVNGTIDY